MNLTGSWSGEFSYPRHAGPTTPFLATIADLAGHLSGTIIEPDTFYGGTLEATLIGHRDGTSVDFIKSYGPGAPIDYANPVDYVGRLSADGMVVSGVWSLLDFDGTFEMHRDALPGEAVVAEDIVELTVPATLER
jgi:hypothetical protein